MAIFFMTVDFIYELTHNPDIMSKMSHNYHIAEKKIPSLDKQTRESVKPTKNSGVKFELFCFDCFSLSKAFGLF